MSPSLTEAQEQKIARLALDDRVEELVAFSKHLHVEDIRLFDIWEMILPQRIPSLAMWKALFQVFPYNNTPDGPLLSVVWSKEHLLVYLQTVPMKKTALQMARMALWAGRVDNFRHIESIAPVCTELSHYEMIAETICSWTWEEQCECFRSFLNPPEPVRTIEGVTEALALCLERAQTYVSISRLIETCFQNGRVVNLAALLYLAKLDNRRDVWTRGETWKLDTLTISCFPSLLRGEAGEEARDRAAREIALGHWDNTGLVWQLSDETLRLFIQATENTVGDDMKCQLIYAHAVNRGMEVPQVTMNIDNDLARGAFCNGLYLGRSVLGLAAVKWTLECYPLNQLQREVLTADLPPSLAKIYLLRSADPNCQVTLARESRNVHFRNDLLLYLEQCDDLQPERDGMLLDFLREMGADQTRLALIRERMETGGPPIVVMKEYRAGRPLASKKTSWCWFRQFSPDTKDRKDVMKYIHPMDWGELAMELLTELAEEGRSGYYYFGVKETWICFAPPILRKIVQNETSPRRVASWFSKDKACYPTMGAVLAESDPETIWYDHDKQTLYVIDDESPGYSWRKLKMSAKSEGEDKQPTIWYLGEPDPSAIPWRRAKSARKAEAEVEGLGVRQPSTQTLAGEGLSVRQPSTQALTGEQMDE